MEEISHVPKNGRNNFHGYDYATEQDMLNAVRIKLAGEKIFISVKINKVEIKDFQNKKGETELLTTIMTTHTFHDGETGESLECTSAGQGTDKGDKGIYKAITGATKYFISKNFLIPTGDDPESFDEKREAAGRVPKKAMIREELPSVQKMAENEIIPPNPWVGKIISLSDMIDGGTWQRWDIVTKDLKLSLFSSSIAEVAANAVTSDWTVEIIWKLKKDKKGNVWKTAEQITRQEW